MKSRAIALCAVLAAFGCSSASSPKAEAPAPNPAEIQAATDIRAFAFSDPGLVAYLKARELAALPGYADWLDVHPQARRVNELFERLRAVCHLEPFEVVDEVLFTVAGDQLMGAARVRLEEEAVFACAENLVGGGTRTKVAGHPAVRSPDESFVLTLVDDVLLFGEEATVGERIKSHDAYDGRIAPSLPDLRHVVALARMQTEEGAIEAIESRFAKTDDGLSLSVRMSSPSPEDADWVLGAMRKALAGEVTRLVEELPEQARPQAANVLAKAAINRRVGRTVEVALPVEALAEGQILLVALVDRLGEAIMRSQRVDEARLVLELLAMRMHSYALSHEAGGQPAFPPSAPRTPKEPTGGSEQVAQAADWSHPTWKLLGFEPPVGLTHSYEIETSADSHRTILRAVADLDGDGEVSILELPLVVDGKSVTIGEVASRGDTE